MKFNKIFSIVWAFLCINQVLSQATFNNESILFEITHPNFKNRTLLFANLSSYEDSRAFKLIEQYAKECKTLSIEIDKDSIDVFKLLPKLFMPNGNSLSTALQNSDYVKFDSICKSKLGIEGKLFNKIYPVFTVQLLLQNMSAKNIHSIEEFINRIRSGRNSKLTVVQYDNISKQIEFAISNCPVENQLMQFSQILRNPNVNTESTNRLSSAYHNFDLNQVNKIHNELKPKDCLFIKRDSRSTNTSILYLMDSISQTNSNFIFLNAANFCGNDGILEMLHQNNYNIIPIPIDYKKINEYISLMERYYKSDEYQNLKIFCDYGIKLDSTEYIFYLYRATAYYGMGSYTNAIRDYSNGLKLKKDDIELLYGRALSYYYLNMYFDSFNDFTRLKNLDPSYSNVSKYYNELNERIKSINIQFDKAYNSVLNERKLFEEVSIPILKRYGEPRFSEGNKSFAIVNNGRFEGVVDKNLNIKVPFEFNSIFDFHNNIAYFWKEHKGLVNDPSGFVDINGKVLKNISWQTWPVFEQNMWRLCKSIENDKSMCYFLDENLGEINTLPIYEQAIFQHPILYKGNFYSKHDGKYNVYNLKGDNINKFPKTIVEIDFERGLFFFKHHGLYGWMDINGNLIQDAIHSFEDKVDKYGNISFTYDVVKHDENGLKINKGDNIYEMIDSLGRTIVHIDYNTFDNYYTINKFNKHRVSKGSLYGVINNEHENILPFMYDDIMFPVDNSENYPVRWKGRFGVVNSKNVQIIPFVYEDCYEIIERKGIEFYIMKKNGYWGMIDQWNRVIIDFKLINGNDIVHSRGCWIIKFNQKEGIVDFNGKHIMNAEYDEIDTKEGYIIGIQNGIKKYFDYKGTKIEAKWEK